MYAPPENAGTGSNATAVMGLARRAWERHMLGWVDDAGWGGAQATPEPRHKGAFKLWQSRSWPLIVRRADADATDDEICLGLPLPPDEDTGEKVRISLRARERHIKKATGAMELAAVLLSSSNPSRAPLAA